MEQEFLRMIQARAARMAIGASAARRQGAAGVVAAARRFMTDLDLAPFGTNAARAFGEHLDGSTLLLKDALPTEASSWGLARKLLNIFLRDCFYTRYLADGYDLESAESLYEVPLDSITATRIRERRPRLPRWTTVKGLNCATSAQYQASAQEVARERGFARVHLDAFWWGLRD